MSFGLYIRQRRIEMGFGLNEFSGRIGISPAYWSRVERGIEKAPRDELIEKTASLLGMSVDELFLQAARLPPDMQKELPQVVSLYRRFSSSVRP